MSLTEVMGGMQKFLDKACVTQEVRVIKMISSNLTKKTSELSGVEHILDLKTEHDIFDVQIPFSADKT